MDSITTMFGGKDKPGDRKADALAVSGVPKGLRARRKAIEEGDITEQDPAEAFKAGYTERVQRRTVP